MRYESQRTYAGEMQDLLIALDDALRAEPQLTRFEASSPRYRIVFERAAAVGEREGTREGEA